MENKKLEKLYLLQLKDIYSAEKQLGAVLPKMTRAVSNKELKNALKECLECTKVHIKRIEEIFKSYRNMKPSGENSNAMEGFIDEFEDMLEEGMDVDLIDAEVIDISQKMEHYQIASYNTVVTYAKMLGISKASDMLQNSLDEEYEADNKLDKLREEILSTLVK